MHRRAVYLLAILLITSFAYGQDFHNDFIALGKASFTLSTPGVTTSGAGGFQGDPAKAGWIGGYDHFFGHSGNALEVDAGHVATDSKLFTPRGVVVDRWHLDKYEFDVLGKHNWLRHHRVSPYFGAGLAAILINGGSTGPINPDTQEGGGSGYDYQMGFAEIAGVDTLIGKVNGGGVYLKTGVKVDFLKASTYSDQTYHSAPTYLVEPLGGFVFEF